VVHVREAEGLGKGLFKEEFLAAVHGNQKLVEVYPARAILVYLFQNLSNLAVGIGSEMFYTDADQFAFLDNAVVVAIDLPKHLPQTVPFLLGDLSH
jgi:hypothetical protein